MFLEWWVLGFGSVCVCVYLCQLHEKEGEGGALMLLAHVVKLFLWEAFTVNIKDKKNAINA